jgi:hypothetical protein
MRIVMGPTAGTEVAPCDQFETDLLDYEKPASPVFLCDERHFRPARSAVRTPGHIGETDHEDHKEDPRAVSSMVEIIARKTQVALSLV